MIWTRAGVVTSDEKSYNDKLYKSYRLEYGKVYGVNVTKYGLWGDLFYYVNGDEIKKFEFSKSETIYLPKGGTTQVMYFNMYDGKIVKV